MIGKRDQRFMFNSQNMKIGERKRNYMGKGKKDTKNFYSPPSCRDLNQRKSVHMRLKHGK